MGKKHNRKCKIIIFTSIIAAIVICLGIFVLSKLSNKVSIGYEAGSKKGIQLNHTFSDDALDLDIKWGLVNFSTKLLTDEPGPYYIEHKGKTYYFVTGVIDQFDKMFSELAQNDVKVVASFVNEINEDYPYLKYSDVYDDRTMYYAFNLDDKESVECIEAYAKFFINRYSASEGGCVTAWCVGNEVNDNLQYHNMNACDMQTYVTQYYKEFKLFYDLIKKQDKMADVFIPLEHRWQTANTMTDYGGRWFLEYFHELELRDKEMDWGVAWHPYPYPLGDPDTLDDGDYPTIDTDETPSYGGEVTLDYTTPIISMKNIDILTDYLKENLLMKNGKVRPVILSEVGYTSNSVVVGENEAKQAANIAYAYYKAETNPYIKALIIRSHCDEFEGSPYFQFGLRHGIANPTKKIAYDVYKTVGTEEGYEYDKMLLSVLGANDWEDIIPGCKRTINDIPKDVKYEHEGKSIEECEVKYPGSQQYTGRPILPAIEVYDGDRLLEEKKDYYTSYTSNVEPGTARVTVVGTGEYSGFLEGGFQIVGEYSAVVDPTWYFEHDQNAREACGGDLTKAESYFVENGIPVGAQGSEEFNVRYYLNNYPDLEEQFGDDLKAVYEHYVTCGKAEGRVADRMLDLSVYKGFDYTYVYDVAFASLYNGDIWKSCGEDPLNMLEYFVNKGMDEGMRGSDRFDWEVYRDINSDLSEEFGDNKKEYYIHYCKYGFDEGRQACNVASIFNTATSYKGSDYSTVFDANYYMNKYEDAKKYAFNHKKGMTRKAAALEHFVLYGMKQGRIGSEDFDPLMYRALYSDVREAYGYCYPLYYIHYSSWGRPEGRFTSTKDLFGR